MSFALGFVCGVIVTIVGVIILMSKLPSLEDLRKREARERKITRFASTDE